MTTEPIAFPSHKCSLTLVHNEHLDNYETAAEWLKEDESRGAPAKWKDDDAKRRAVETNEVWELQWYPRTPIGSYRIAAPTLNELLEFAATYDSGEGT